VTAVIFGIGTDVVQLAVERGLTRGTASTSCAACSCPRRKPPSAATAPGAFLAMRFAAKEAIVKALGTGFAHGIWIRDVGVNGRRLGRPAVIWSSAAARCATGSAPRGPRHAHRRGGAGGGRRVRSMRKESQ